MVFLSRLDPDKWFIKLGLTIFITFSILMILMQVLPASLVKEVGGAKRWIHIGPISIAPVEFFKIGFLFFITWSFSKKLSNNHQMGFIEEIKLFYPYLILFVIVSGVIAVLQKDLGQVVVLGAILMTLFLIIGSSLKFFFMLLFGVFLSIVGLILIAPHRIARIKSWWISVQDNFLSLFPFESVQSLRIDVAKEPYQISNSLNAIHNGGFFGTGLGNGQFKLGYLSEVHTDFIIAGISEEFGVLGVSFVTALIFFVIFRIFSIGSRVGNYLYFLFAVGVGLTIAFSFLLNVYGISGITPIKGIAVPFLSYGGSHILASSVAIGFILMISKKVPRDEFGKAI